MPLYQLVFLAEKVGVSRQPLVPTCMLCSWMEVLLSSPLLRGLLQASWSFREEIENQGCCPSKPELSLTTSLCSGQNKITIDPGHVPHAPCGHPARTNPNVTYTHTHHRDACGRVLGALLSSKADLDTAQSAARALVARISGIDETTAHTLCTCVTFKCALASALARGRALMGGGGASGAQQPGESSGPVGGQDRTRYLQVCEDAAHALHALVNSNECAAAVASEDCGLLRVLADMAYCPAGLELADRRKGGSGPGMQPDWEPDVGSAQAVAAGTLAHLCSYECIRSLPAVHEALNPSMDQLSRLASLLMVTPPEPLTTGTQQPQSVGGATGGPTHVPLPAVAPGLPPAPLPPTQARPGLRARRGLPGMGVVGVGSSPATPATPQPPPAAMAVIHLADKCYRAALLAAVAQHGGLAWEALTGVLVRTRGALGAVVALLADVARPATSLHELRRLMGASPLVGNVTPLGTLGLGGLGESAGRMAGAGNGGLGDLVVSVPDAWLREYQHALAQLSMPRLDPSEPKLLAHPAGTLAALALCRVAASRKEVARVLAAKTALVPVLLAVVGCRSTALGLWHHSGDVQAVMYCL